MKNNKLQTYESSWFVNNPLLCTINLEHNIITFLPRKILGNGNNRQCSVDLILSHNKLVNIDEEAFLGYKFNKLYLDHNDLTILPKKVFSNAIEITDLKLNNNNISSCPKPEMEKIKKYDVSANPWDTKCLTEFEQKITTPLPTKTTTMIYYYVPFFHRDCSDSYRRCSQLYDRVFHRDFGIHYEYMHRCCK